MVAVFAKNGISLPRTSQEQLAQAPIKNDRPLLPGDLVFSEGVHPGHVGLYIGDGLVLEDPHTGDHVKTIALASFGWNGESARWWGGNKPTGGSTTPKRTATTPSADGPKIDLGGSKKPKTTPTTLPGAVALQLAQAEGTKGIADDITANQAAIDVLTKRLKTTTDKSIKADLVTAINGYRQAITEARAKLATTAQKAAVKLPNDVKVQLARAKATSDLQDDITANQAAIDVLEKRLKTTTDKNVKASLQVAIAGYQKAINEARKKLATAAAAANKRLAEETTIKTSFAGAQKTLQQAFTLDLLPASEEQKLKGQETKLAQIIRKAEQDGKISPAELSKIQASWKAMSAGISDATQAVAAQAKATFDRAWGGVTNTITRALQEQWQITVRDFDRESTKGVNAIQKKASDEIQAMQRAFQKDLDAFDRDTQKGLDALAVAQTPEEKALADFVAKRAADQATKDAAQRAVDLQTAQTSLAALQAAGVGGTTADGQVVTQADIDQATQQVSDILDSINQAALDAQQQALQDAADASRKAQDAATQQAQDAYQQQRDDLRQSLQDAETERETARQTQADNDAQAYQDQRDAQMQALSDLHDDQMTALQNDLDDWNLWLSNKQKSYAAFLQWLVDNPVTSAVAGQAPTNLDLGGSSSADGGNPAASNDPGPLTDARQRVGKGAVAFARGGKVPGRYIGVDDTVMARLTPGETVISRQTTDALEQFLASAGSVSGRPLQVTLVMDHQKVGTIVTPAVTAAQARRIGYRVS